MTGRIVLAGIGGIMAIAVLLLLSWLGVPMEFALMWLIVVIAVAVASRQVFFDETVEWPPPERERMVRGSDVSRLAWSLNTRTGVAGYVVVGRVQRILRRRLAHHGLDLDDPVQHARIDALLGSGIREAVHRKEVRSSDIDRLLDAIEKLSPEPEETR
ncbi:hypothetical protein [Microbacterium sp. W4I20]|uniref:hypothetical protein n=1 Tax=Microbacterium sp. W4I20 TaxID=3042262 RepID=UPI00278913BA|nr:hypothetical protein [Microbacterium sp. W4I20]MDQ0725121.1 hypothetical protein [Microbacterium sp. W4I20]